MMVTDFSQGMKTWHIILSQARDQWVIVFAWSFLALDQRFFLTYWQLSGSWNGEITLKSLIVQDFSNVCKPGCTFNQLSRALWIPLNPLSPNSDQHQFSPNNVHMLSREMVMRLNKMVTKEKMLWSVIKFSQLIL